MYWKLLLLLGVFTKLSVSQDSTPRPDLKQDVEDLRECYENIANASSNASSMACHNFNDLRKQIQKYSAKFEYVHEHKSNRTINEKNVDLLEYAVTRPNYPYVAKHMNCMNLTYAKIACADLENTTNSNKTEPQEKIKLHAVLFAKDFDYKKASCAEANITKSCVIENGLKGCDDKVKQWTADIFDFSIKKCTNATALKSYATGKYPLPLLISFLVMTATAVLVMSPASE